MPLTFFYSLRAVDGHLSYISTRSLRDSILCVLLSLSWLIPKIPLKRIGIN
jgi:hypothetical protein